MSEKKTMTLTEFCDQFGMVPAPGLDGSQTVDAFLADQGAVNEPVDPEAAKVDAFLNDPQYSDDVKLDAALLTLFGGESVDDAIRDALAAHAQPANA